MKRNYKLRAEARVALNGKWLMAAIAYFVYMAIVVVLSCIPYIGKLASILVVDPLAYGLVIVFLSVYRNNDINLNILFSGFKDYGRIFLTLFLKNIYIFLWSLLLIVPGIVKGYSYAMTYYILKDEPGLKYNAAIEKSMAMMDRHKMKLFLLDLSFIGWALLSIITLGIGYLFLVPYSLTARAAFYEDLRACQNRV